ncbi:MAG: HEAT repeat domain-containing protein [Deltaproteobacteria bacterium]|nr:HEAT repeat domain-containing protein [Deltaproteobacteria bacterium]
MSQRGEREVREAAERATLAGLATLAADDAALARLAAAARAGGAAAEGTAVGVRPTPRDVTRLLRERGLPAPERFAPPRLPSQDAAATTTLERLDAALFGTTDDERLAAAERASLRSHPAHAAEKRVAAMKDPQDLLRVATGGTSWERRAAVRRLEDFLRGDGRGFLEADRKALAEALELQRWGALGREVDQVLAAVSGAAGGRARARIARGHKLLERLEKDVRRFWDGEVPGDPVVGLDDESLATLGTFIADAPDIVVGHLDETLRRLATERQDAMLERVVSALALGADERLVPSLVRVLQDASVAARVHAARPLAAIDDPRVVIALRKAFRHATVVEEKLAIAGALAAHGDRRGAGTVLDHLAAEQPPYVVELALEAMRHAGEPAHVGRVAPFLDHARISVARAAAAALGARGDAAALEVLAPAAARAELRSQVERAVGEIRARLDLAGTPDPAAAPLALPVADERRPQRTRLGARIVGRLYFALGLFWLAFRRRTAALGAFDMAHSHHPYLVGPLLARARIMLRRKELGAAVEALRAAIRVRAATVLQLPDRANFVIRVYLRHADVCSAAGRHVPALEALDELLGYDLRFADVDLRLEAQRRRETVSRAQRREE